MTDHDYDKTVERVEDLRRDYAPKEALLRDEMRIDHTDRQMEREHVAHEEGDEFWKDPSAWEGRDDG